MIKINLDEFNKELTKFENSVKEFRPYTESFVKNTTNKLKGFNSDFISNFEKLLDSMSNDNACKILANAEKLSSSAKVIIKMFEDLDGKIAKEFKKGD